MFWRHNLLGIAWAVFILVLCGLPGDQFEKSKYENADKVIHGLLFAVLYYLLCVGFIKQRTFRYLRERTLLKVFAISTVYGVLIEILQGTLFVNRAIEFGDILFNLLGCFIGFVVFASIYGKDY